MNRLIIIGAGGHGKVVADIARLNGYTDIVFLDNTPNLKECAGYPVLGPDVMSDKVEGEIFIAIGATQIRKRLMEREKGRVFPVLVHPSAVVADDVNIGEGSVVMAGAVINPGVRIGKGCIVNTSCSVDHDCKISDLCHVSVGSHLSGNVSVGEETWIGVGAVISNNISICKSCIIGAGAVVIRDIDIKGTYVGVPARHIS